MSLVENLGPELDITIEPAAFGGHCLYVRRGLPGDVEVEGTRLTVKQEGIVIPDATGYQSVWFEVLGVGRKFGTVASKHHTRKHRSLDILDYERMGYGKSRATELASRPCAVGDEVIGKLVYIPLPWPLVDSRVQDSPFASYEFFVEESLPAAYIDAIERVA